MADAVDIDNDDKGTYLKPGTLYKLETDQSCVIQNSAKYDLKYQFDDVDQQGWNILDIKLSIAVPQDKTIYFRSTEGTGKITRINV